MKVVMTIDNYNLSIFQELFVRWQVENIRVHLHWESATSLWLIAYRSLNTPSESFQKGLQPQIDLER